MKKGVLLVNLGSPNSTKVKDVRKYLNQFLMDKRVIDLPYLSRAFLVKGIILNTRPKKSAHAYSRIWWKEGSPLIVLSKRLQDKVQKLTPITVEIAMRYGDPSIESGIQKLYNQGVKKILLLPMYPQFAMATTETITVLAENIRRKKFPDLEIEAFDPFYHREDYIKVLANSISEYLKDKTWDHLLFSYHGVPERHIYKSDITQSHCKIDSSCCSTPSDSHSFCYRHQCFATTNKIAEALQLNEDQYSNSFQSRLGKDIWLQPYTDQTLSNLAKQGVKHLAVVTPAFTCDCLETLEEIAMEGKKLFLEEGGEQFHTIPCLNDRDDWSETLSQWINHWNEN